MTYRTLTACRLCSGAIHEVLNLGSTPLANELHDTAEASLNQARYPLRLVRCDDCGHVQLGDVVAAELLFPPNYPYRSGTSKAFVAHLEELAESTGEGFYSPTGAPLLVVDIGSNDGSFLGQFVHSDTIGVEPSRAAATAAMSKGVLTVNAPMTSELGARLVAKMARLPDRIFALNSLAHIDDINDVMQGVRVMMSPTGILTVEVGYLPAVLLANGDVGHIYHEHLDYWHLRPFDKLMRKHGLYVQDVRLLPHIQGGSIRFDVMKLEASSTSRSPRVAALELAESYLDIEGELKRLPERVKSRQELVGEGVGEVAYGCPARMTTVAHIAGIRPGDFAMFVDDTPEKFGKFAPGLGAPIGRPAAALSGENLPTLERHHVVLFSWNYADDIRARFPDVDFVVPLKGVA